MRLYLIDIGGYTTDVLLLRNGKPDLQFCRSLECGTITMNNEIIRKINARYDLRIDDEHISAVLNNEETILPAEVKVQAKELQRHRCSSRFFEKSRYL